MSDITRRALDLLITEAEMQRGYKDEECETGDGDIVFARLIVPDAAARRSLFSRFVELGLETEQNEKDFVRELLHPDFANDTFLDSLEPKSLHWLRLVGVAICVGPEGLKRHVANRPKNPGGDFFSKGGRPWT